MQEEFKESKFKERKDMRTRLVQERDWVEEIY